ncbi:hypothetical protein A2U01_0110126, partial [Trifolium medium]|nr:hypothetical protein [Trifolium medium]
DVLDDLLKLLVLLKVHSGDNAADFFTSCSCVAEGEDVSTVIWWLLVDCSLS